MHVILARGPGGSVHSRHLKIRSQGQVLVVMHVSGGMKRSSLVKNVYRTSCFSKRCYYSDMVRCGTVCGGVGRCGEVVVELKVVPVLS